MGQLIGGGDLEVEIKDNISNIVHTTYLQHTGLKTGSTYFAKIKLVHLPAVVA